MQMQGAHRLLVYPGNRESTESPAPPALKNRKKKKKKEDGKQSA